MKKASWDTALGYEMYLEGKSDGEIADAFGIQTCTVRAYRLRKWRQAPDGGRGKGPAAAGAPMEEIAVSAPAEVPCEEVPPGAADGVAGLTAETAAEAMEDPAELAGEWTEEEVTDVGERKNDVQRMMGVIGEVTKDMSGIKAVCTGSIIQALWNWNSVDDLREAKAIIEYLEESDCFG